MLNPMLRASPPVFQLTITRLAPFLSRPVWAVKYCRVMLVGAVTVSDCVAVLFARFGSVWSAVTVAVFTMTPDWLGMVRIVTVAVPAFAMLPKTQVTVPPASEQEPWLVVEER